MESEKLQVFQSGFFPHLKKQDVGSSCFMALENAVGSQAFMQLLMCLENSKMFS